MSESTTILLADDEAGFRTTLVDALGQRGFTTVSASCGQQALEMGRDIRPALSVLDINMPDMTGVDVLQRWRQEGLNWPVVLMTAEPNVTLRERARTLGAMEILDKPFSLALLITVVQRVIQS